VRKDEEGKESIVNMGAKATTSLDSGDRVIIQSPGGGAWGSLEANGINGHA
jgi:5-oxoprolinase (ATP-hydrolysing)